MFKGKNIVIGVCGGIAVYKACDLVSKLVKNGANVDVIMTKNATQFVTPLTFESLTNTKVVTDMFELPPVRYIEHVALAKKADCFIIVPATANIIGKIACGIADDMLTTTLLATKKPVIVCPAMNTGMYTNPVFERNLNTIQQLGYIIVTPEEGRLACGDVGKGRLASVETILEKVQAVLYPKQDFKGKRVLITAGGTAERIDRVRFITNDSSGKMGAALARRAIERGATVTIVAGRHSAPMPSQAEVVEVFSTTEMRNQVISRVQDNEYFIMAAAPCDFRPAVFTDGKIKDKNLTITFVQNPDIAAEVGAIKGTKHLTIFAAEAEDVKSYAKSKLLSKNADLCVANDITAKGAGFDVDTNIVSLITAGEITDLPLMTKDQAADIILDKIISQSKDKA